MPNLMLWSGSFCFAANLFGSGSCFRTTLIIGNRASSTQNMGGESEEPAMRAFNISRIQFEDLVFPAFAR